MKSPPIYDQHILVMNTAMSSLLTAKTRLHCLSKHALMRTLTNFKKWGICDSRRDSIQFGYKDSLTVTNTVFICGCGAIGDSELVRRPRGFNQRQQLPLDLGGSRRILADLGGSRWSSLGSVSMPIMCYCHVRGCRGSPVSRATYYRHAKEERDWRRKQAVNKCVCVCFFFWYTNIYGIPNLIWECFGIVARSFWYSLTLILV